MKVWADSLEHAWCAPRLPGMFEMEQALGNEINRAVTGQISAKEGARQRSGGLEVDHGKNASPAVPGRWPTRTSLRGCMSAPASLCLMTDAEPGAHIAIGGGGASRLPPTVTGLAAEKPLLRKLFPYLLVGPAALYLLTITLYPAFFAIYQSLFVVKFVNWTFVGAENYVRILQDREFWAALATHRDHRRHLAGAADRHRARTRLFRLPRPVRPRLAHHLPDADAVHALGGRVPLEACLQRRPGRVRPAHVGRSRRRQRRLAGVRLAGAGNAHRRRRVAVDSLPVHHLRRGAAGPGPGGRRGRSSRGRQLAGDLLEHLAAE